jgi:hypothetical protein
VTAVASATDAVDLYWLPLGAGGHSVKYNGRVFEWLAARREGRPACDLYHAALQVLAGGERYVIEMAPAWDASGATRGAVSEGPVGARWLGRSRMFRYELRCWKDGEIPDIAYAVASPERLTTDAARSGALLGCVPEVPTCVWGRDAAGAGDMWNSNSVVAWLLIRSGIGVGDVVLPTGGRAPGWAAGVHVAGLGK